jgi:hypothetical protein
VPYRTGPVPGDSIFGGNNDINPTPTKGTFIFHSPADSNLHRFEVVSVDNSDAEDPVPAATHFWTLESPVPTLVFTSVPPNDQFAIRYRTERWDGLRFTFSTRDPSTFEQEYSWSVDDTLHWSDWDPNPEALVTALNFSSVYRDTHMIYARARNRWGVVSVDSSRRFTAVVPAFDSSGFTPRILIINSTRPVSPTSPWYPDSNLIKAFYSELMDSVGKPPGTFDIWSTQSQTHFPTRRILGQYSAIIYVLDQKIAPIGGAAYLFNAARRTLVQDYLNVGGKLIFSSPPEIELAFGGPFPYTVWAEGVFHIVTERIRKNPNADFAGGRGLRGYPNFQLDPAKFHPDSLLVTGGVAALRGLAVNYPLRFAETISLFDSRTDDPFYENQPLGVRYLAPEPVPPARRTYSVVFFAFPLYYAEKSAAIGMLRQALFDIQE